MLSENCRTLVVTGGSRGIGAAVAQLAGSRGYSVAVNFRCHEAAARAVVEEIRSSGGSAVAIRGDVALEAARRADQGAGLNRRAPGIVVRAGER